MPETAELTSEALAFFLDKYPFCYLKSNYGSYGAEVVRVEKTKAGYVCRAGGCRIKEWSFDDLASLYAFAGSYLGANAIVQQGIKLATINGRIFDLRILVLKDHSGCWQVPAISFRIARPGAVVTNVMSGADEILVGPQDPLPYQGVSWASLVAFAGNVALALEACFGLHGEIGLDVGIDKQGRLWVIEANSKPNTAGYEQLAPAEVSSLVYSLPLEYAKFLAQRMYALQQY
ncbi:MAG: YheC/YheD family protein [Firmicutes bacterium]|nr:YheC/YheD family protein [Bacillota bacterium]